MEPTIIPAAGKKWSMTGNSTAWRGAASGNGRSGLALRASAGRCEGKLKELPGSAHQKR